jgi:hypothetical protein
VGSCVVAGAVRRALLIPGRGGYLALEEGTPPSGFELGDGDFYGSFRLTIGERSFVAGLALTPADQLDLLYFFDILDRVTGGFPFATTCAAPGGEVVLRSLVEGEGHRPRRWAIELSHASRASEPVAVLDLDSYVVGRIAWDLVEFLPGVSDADMDWPNLASDVLIAVREAMEQWEPAQQHVYDEREAPGFPLQALAGHLDRGDTAEQLLAFIEAQLRQLRIEPVQERERRFVDELVGWRAHRHR